MKHSVPHDLDLETARLATDAALNEYCNKYAEYNPEFCWLDDKSAEIAFSVKGVAIKGNFALKPTEILMDLKVPFAFKLFKKKALAVVEGEIEKWVQRAREGEFEGLAKHGEGESTEA